MMDRKFNVDVLWNLASVVVLAVSGVLLNILLGRLYGAEVLGVFNQVLSLFIVAGQLGVFGFHYSAMRAVAEHEGDESKMTDAAWSALLLTLAFAAGAGVLSFATVPLVRLAFDSDAVAEGWTYAIPGVFFFAVNKLLLAVLNGRRRMRWFAAFQCVRYLGIVAALAAFYAGDVDARYVPAIITLAELALLSGLFPVAWSAVRPRSYQVDRAWLKTHWSFGAKSYLGGASVELNSKVDILILGVFASDALVGVYSMATLFLEGLMQLGVAIRSNVNPLLTQVTARGDPAGFAMLVRKLKPRIWAFIAVAGAATVALYPLFVLWIVGDPTFSSAHGPLAILVAGFVLGAGYFPFTMLLLQAGHPGAQSIYHAISLALNAVLNFALVPSLGLYGSAIGTSVAFLASLVVFRRMALKRTGLSP